MPITLVTGPANSGKAGEVLGRYRERLDDQALLVVPRFEDVEHTRRELAATSVVFGARVVRFSRALELASERAGVAAFADAASDDPGAQRPPAPRVASRLQRELVMEEAVRAADLRAMAASARGAGFPRAALRLVDELQRAMVEPERLATALEAWGRSGGAGRRRYAAEVAALYGAYRERLEAAGLVDADVLARRALDALRREPARWGATPLLLYGFDDFTPLELDLLETVGLRCGADVVVSLPHEPGRPAFRAIAPAFARLAELAGDQVALPPSDAHYDASARSALAHVERGLFEGAAPAERPPPGGAVRLLLAGGERAEVEQVAAQVLALLRDGVRAGDVAVVFRRPERYASLVEQVFAAYGVPFSIHRRVRLSHTALGRGVCALVRCTLPGAGDDDLVAYLRTAGRLRAPHLADRLEAGIRRRGLTGLEAARDLWEAERWPLDELDRLGGARSTVAFLSELERQLERLFGTPYERQAHLLSGPEVEDARAFAAARAAVRDLRALAERGARIDRRRVLDVLEAAEVHAGGDPAPDRVRVATPDAIRARRFAAVFVCGLQEGEFPRPAPPEPFLSDDARRELASEGGLALPVREDDLDRERYLFYVCASRAERLLVLSTRLTDEEGNPEPRSFLVDEVAELFDPGALAGGAELRPLAAVTWPAERAPTAVEAERAAALAGPRRREPRPHDLHEPEVLEDLAERREFSAGALETYAGCGVKWVVERLLDPLALEPDPEPMVRGSYAHAVLKLTFERLRERTGERRVTRANLPLAEEILLAALREKADEFRLSPKGPRVRALARRLEFDLVRHLRHEAEAGGTFEPRELELAFGMAEEGEIGLPALELEEEGISLRGRIDRVDARDGHAVVRDYKSGRRVFPVAKWEEENHLQAALYMLAVREVLGLEPVAGLYVPLGGTDRAPRGVVSEPWAEAVGSDLKAPDVRPPEEVADLLERAREKVRETVARLRGGEARPCPASCDWRGRCAYPSVCREEGRP